MLSFVTYRWGTKYTGEHVMRLQRALARHYDGLFQFTVVGNNPDGISHETRFLEFDSVDTRMVSVHDGCYVRLRLFNPEYQRHFLGDRIVWLDLDLVICGPVNRLFNRPDQVVLYRGGHFQSTPVNGSVGLVRKGAHAEVWSRWSETEAFKVATKTGQHLGTDQTWLAERLPDAPGWTWHDGIYGFRKPGWPAGSDDLPRDAKIVTFAGRADPSRLNLAWIREYWR